MRAIWKREFRACFYTVTGWLFLAATLAFYFLYFYVYNLSYGYPSISYAMNAIAFLFLITVPLLTMRILAEERHSKTDQLILTAPVSVGKIVIGKYLALAAVFTIAVLAIGLSLVLLGSFGTISYAENAAALLGFWLYGLVSIAVGTFVSSLTESQVIAAVLAFVCLFLGYMMEGITQVISSSGNLLTRILNCYNLTTTQSIQKRRWSVSVKKPGLGVFHAGFAAAAAGAVIACNLAADALPDSITKIDLTSAKLYSVTDDTKRMLADLSTDKEKKVELYVLANEATQDEQLASTLRHYAELSPNITVTYADPAVSPNFYEKYTQDPVSVNSVIVVCNERSKVINYDSIYETEVDYQTYTSQTTGYDGEGQLTSAIQYVTNDDMRTVYEITGHGETSLSGSYQEAVQKMNLNLQSINLIETDSLPDDCAAVVIQGPQTDFSKDDAQKIMDYLADGGKVFLTLSYTEKPLANVQGILEAYQLELKRGMVVETNAGNYYQNPLYLLPDISYDTVTAGVSDEYVLVPRAQGIAYPDEEEDSTLSYTELLHTSDQSYLKTDVMNMMSFEKEDGDLDGPFTAGISAVDASSGAQLIVYTSMEMFTEDADYIVSGNNAALFAASISSLAGEEGESSLIVIPVKKYSKERLALPQGTVMITGFTTILAIPLLLLASGIFIWMKRRKA